MEKKIDIEKLFAAIYRSLHIYKGVAVSMDEELMRQGFVAVDSPNGVRFAEIKQPQYTNDAPLDYDNELNPIYPTEFKESEDERIRKEIIESIKGNMSVIHKDKCLAWLEKQGSQNLANSAQTCKDEQKPTDKVQPKFKVGDKVKRKNTQEEICTIEEMDEISYYCDYTNFDIVDQDNWELVPEPRFKVGDWIVKNDGNDCFSDGSYVLQIMGIYDEGYTLSNDNFLREPFLHTYRLWTIQDAKEGDVLSNGKMIVIFKNFEEPSYRQHIVAHIGLDTSGDIQITDGTWILGLGQTTPATKEQRDFLFQKMREAGYEWDAEKKELKKIEQKPAWSEEDKKEIKRIIGLLEGWLSTFKETCYAEDCKCGIVWLKSLKERYTWKPSDEQIEALKYSLGEGGTYNKEALMSLLTDLSGL